MGVTQGRESWACEGSPAEQRRREAAGRRRRQEVMEQGSLGQTMQEVMISELF